MEQRNCVGYIITQSIHVADTEFVLGEHPETGICATWQCKNGDNYFWGHYYGNRYDALKDLCQRASNEVDRLAFIGAISLPSGKEKGRGRER